MYFILIFIILIILFKFRKVETFYTLFNPFYLPGTVHRYGYYHSGPRHNDTNKNSIRLLIPSETFNQTHIKLFLKSLLAYDRELFSVHIEKYNDNYIDVIDQTGNNENIISLVSEPNMFQYYENTNMKSNISNINLVTTFDENYIFVISAFNSLKKTKFKKVAYLNQTDKNIAKDINFNLNLQWKLENHCSNETDILKLINKTESGEIGAIVLSGNYPNKILTEIFYRITKLNILPLYQINNFIPIYVYTYIDLVKLPPFYLPKVIDGTKYVYYNSWMPTYKYNNIFITNKNTNNQVVNNFIQHLLNTKDLIEKSSNPFSLIPIDLHPETRRCYIENGFISTIKNGNCRYTFGHSKCDKTSLKNQHLLGNKYHILQ